MNWFSVLVLISSKDVGEQSGALSFRKRFSATINTRQMSALAPGREL